MTICRICRQEYTKRSMKQKTCREVECEMAWLELEKLKVANRARREAKAKLKTRQQWLKEAQSVFNKYIRIRDRALPCISCQRPLGRVFHAGHYISVGASSALRFDVDFENGGNVNGQCIACNHFGAGRQSDYRAGLVARYSEECANRLDHAERSAHISIDDCKAIIETYRAKIKALEAT